MVGNDPVVAAIESVAGFVFLMAFSWAIAGIVFLISGLRADRLTLVIVSVAITIATSVAAIVQLAFDMQ